MATPVWIVRTEDDEVRVLGASVRLERAGNPRFVLAAFDPECACFRSDAPVVWNLEGEASARVEVDYSMFGGLALGIRSHTDGDTAFWMDRFDFERHGEFITIGTRWAATEYASPRDSLPVAVAAGSRPECPELPMWTDIEHALTLPVGQRAHISGRVLMHDGVARLCAWDETVDGHCPEDAPRVFDPSFDVLERASADAVALLSSGPLVSPWLFVRRAGDGFADVSTEECDFTRSWPNSAAPAVCFSPNHDESWVRTPFNADSGIWVEAPVGCVERESPNTRMLRVRGRGSRRAGSADSIPERCHAPSLTDDCPEIPWRTLYESINTAISQHNQAHPTFNARFDFGIGGCFNATPSTEGRLALTITDWRYADEAIQLLNEALEHWNVSETFWVSVAAVFCMVPG